ncbi:MULTISPECIES: ABC transporter permease [unclassified Rhodococcus (in: high G+C Gram-positive bacteria)]|uniref:ABC transporter permease n=1 Tax=unclassified Rhodococcus (in: high G+C Gram-positive bacteria) TaxID=192944 RepID=UPI00233EDC54|nr:MULTISPECIES: ABC transporter permease [unclassified Rhodococcus (in: high G+C Gram-positive bacteria)]MDC3729294.1 ABC transporter permease [Rhodococcus sp. Rp3]WSE24165.1 ABC transporter permease [Rhodococcus sp. PD04]
MKRPDSSVVVAVVVVVGLLLAGFGPLPFDPREPHLEAILTGPGTTHWFGTDRSGLDVFSVTLAATAEILPIALVGTLVGGVLGVVLGALAASVLSGRESGSSGRSEWLLRVLDMMQSLPVAVLMIIVVGIGGRGTNVAGVIAALALVNIPLFAKVTYAQALSVVHEPYVVAARGYGASRTRIALRHILPGVSGIIASQFSLSIGNAIIALAALGFLGIGIAPPDPSWGELIRQGSEEVASGVWWLLVFPTATICALVLALNALARRLSTRKGLAHA